MANGNLPNASSIYWINGNPVYANNIAIGMAFHSPKNKILLVDSLDNAMPFKFVKSIIQENENRIKEAYGIMSNSFANLNKAALKMRLNNLYFLPGFGTYAMNKRMHEDKTLMREYVKGLENLGESQQYNTIIVNDSDTFDALKLFGIADKRFIFLDSDNEKISRQLTRANQALLARIEDDIEKHIPEMKLMASHYRLEAAGKDYRETLSEIFKKHLKNEILDIMSSSANINKEFGSLLNESKKHLEKMNVPVDVYFQLNSLFKKDDDSMYSLYDEVRKIKDNDVGAVISYSINSVIEDSKIKLFYLPPDEKLIGESVNRGAPLLWHKYNSAAPYKKYEKYGASDFIKNLEEIVDYMLDININMPVTLLNNGDSYSFTGEFTPQKKDFVLKAKEEIEKNYFAKKEKQEKQKTDYSKALKSLKNGFYAGACLAGLIFFSSLLVNPIADYCQKSKESKLISLKGKRNANYALILSEKKARQTRQEQDKAKAIELEKQKKSEEEQKSREKSEAQRKEQLNAEKEREMKEKTERVKQEAVIYAQKEVMKDIAFLSDVEKINKFIDKFFNAEDVNKKYALEINFKNNEIVRKERKKDYVFPLQGDEPQKIKTMKEKCMQKYIQKYINQR